jgi:hypothetical protein
MQLLKYSFIRFFFTLNVGTWALLPSAFIIPLNNYTLIIFSFRFLTAEFQIKIVVDRDK